MFDNIDIDDLRKELRRREKLEQEKSKPQQLDNFNIEPLREICQTYIDDLFKGGYVDDDMDHYIFETAMECIFGKNVWAWINSQS